MMKKTLNLKIVELEQVGDNQAVISLMPCPCSYGGREERDAAQAGVGGISLKVLKAMFSADALNKGEDCILDFIEFCEQNTDLSRQECMALAEETCSDGGGK